MRTTVDVLNAPAGFGNAQVNLVTAQHDRVVASASRLSPQTLGLPTSPCTGRDLFTRCATRAGDEDSTSFSVATLRTTREYGGGFGDRPNPPLFPTTF
jgi:hypothetical protein